MYPYPCYIRYGLTNDTQQEYRQVMITSYTDAISIGAFKNLNLDTTYTLSQKVTGNFSPYKYSYSVKFRGEWEVDQKINEERYRRRPDLDFREKVVGEQINLMDYYKEIGYDYKKKHFNGKTLRRHILDNIKQEELV